MGEGKDETALTDMSHLHPTLSFPFYSSFLLHSIR